MSTEAVHRQVPNIMGTLPYTGPDIVFKGPGLSPSIRAGASAGSPKVTFRDVALFYPQVVDYLRLVLVGLAAFTCVHEDWDVGTACFLLYSVALDYVDGKLARRCRQCSVLGDGLDWTADVCTSWVFVMWWGRLDQRWQPCAALWTMAETGAAIFDFAMLATEQYTPRPPQTGFFYVLELLAPAGRWTWAGYFAWLAYPLWCTARCLSLYAALGNPVAIDVLLWLRSLLVVPAATYVWYNVALFASCLTRWRERPRNHE
jgi:phosphatidylglycerophosphate synthase